MPDTLQLLCTLISCVNYFLILLIISYIAALPFTHEYRVRYTSVWLWSKPLVSGRGTKFLCEEEAQFLDAERLYAVHALLCGGMHSLVTE